MGKIEMSDFPKYTVADYSLWKGEWELIAGMPLAMSPSPMRRHQSVCREIVFHLTEIFEECEKCEVLYEIDWIIDEENVVRPDIIVICDSEDKEYITKAPKIIFEVISKSTAHNDRVIKYKLYESEGVKYYIIVDPVSRISKVYSLKDGEFIKQCDASVEKVKFNFDECEIEFDFERVWRKMQANKSML